MLAAYGTAKSSSGTNVRCCAASRQRPAEGGLVAGHVPAEAHDVAPVPRRVRRRVPNGNGNTLPILPSGGRAVASRAWRVVYNKLVRDYIPGIIAMDGRQPATRVLDQAGYLAALRAKLVEEAQEAQAGAGRMSCCQSLLTCWKYSGLWRALAARAGPRNRG